MPLAWSGRAFSEVESSELGSESYVLFRALLQMGELVAPDPTSESHLVLLQSWENSGCR